MRKKRKAKCKICSISILVTTKHYGRGGGIRHKKTTIISESDEGVYYEDGKCWFCNGCWGKIIGGKDKSAKKQ